MALEVSHHGRLAAGAVRRTHNSGERPNSGSKRWKRPCGVRGGRAGRRGAGRPWPGLVASLLVADRSADAAGSRLFGRRDELERLDRLIGAGYSLVVVSGEAGVGKSTLVNEVVSRRERDGISVARGASGDSTPRRFGLWLRPARSLGVDLPENDDSVALAEQVWDLSDQLCGALGSGGWLVVLEDVHRSEPSSVAVLQDVAARITGSSTTIIAVVRTPPLEGECDLSELFRAAEVVTLGTLGAGDIAELVRSSTGTMPSPDRLAVLMDSTGGNPLLLREVLAAGGSGVLGAPAGGLLHESIDRLGPDCADALTLLALAGADAPLRVLAHASGRSIVALTGLLDDAVEAGVVAVAGRRWWFRHDLFAEAAVLRVAPMRRRRLHQALAEAWELEPDPLGVERIRHLIAAVPAVATSIVVDEAEAVAARLVARRRPGDGCDVLAAAAAAIEGRDLAPAREARLLWLLGEAHWAAGDTDVALAVFGRAAAFATAVDDIDLVTSIEVAALRRLDPFVPDPVGRERLAELDRRAASDDSPVRVALLGRRSLLAMQPPTDPVLATELASDAVSMARRLGEPSVLLGALHDRSLLTTSRDELVGRGALAEEMILLAGAAGRPDHLLVGHELRYSACISVGDMDGAASALDELETYAVIASSPYWRRSAAVRRCVLLGLRGERAESLMLIERLVRTQTAGSVAHELLPTELAVRTSTALMYGFADDELGALRYGLAMMYDDAPSSFIQLAQAILDLVLGDRSAARRRAEPWLGRPETAFASPNPLETMAIMSWLAVELRISHAALRLLTQLSDFAGLLATESGVALEAPVDHHLAGLAMLTDDLTYATDRARAAVAMAERMSSPPLTVRCLLRLSDILAATGDLAESAATRDRAASSAEPFGIALRPSWSIESATTGLRSAAPVAAVQLERTPTCWRLVADGNQHDLPQMVGFGQLARLLSSPGTELSAGELAGRADADRIPVAGDLGPVLDARSKREYRRRVSELQIEIADADHDADLERASRARLEYDALLDELRRATGLAGRDRPQGSGVERDRINVTRNVHRAIATIERLESEVGAHLRMSVHTGHFCRYEPDPASALRWRVRS
jgi:AAA ATPase domain